MPYKLFELFSQSFQLKTVECALLSTTNIATTMHINKLSSRDAMLQEVINAIRHEFEVI